MAHWHIWTASAALSVILTAGSTTAQSQALQLQPQPQIYGGLAVGTATYFDQSGVEFDFFGFVIAGQLGFRISPDIRIEGELAYETTSGEIDGTNIDFDLDVLRISGSAYYDFNTISVGGLVPFAGVGLGISALEVEGGGDDTEISANLDGGASLSLGSNIDIVPLARWELTDDASNFQVRAGARLWF